MSWLDSIGSAFFVDRRCYEQLQRYASGTMQVSTIITILKKKYTKKHIVHAIEHWFKHIEDNTRGPEFHDITREDLEKLRRNPDLIDQIA